MRNGASDTSGEPGLDQFIVEFWQPLRALARRQLLDERSDHSLRPTELAHEVYLRLRQSSPGFIQNEQAFLRLSATVMRRVLIDYARGKGRKKRAHVRADLDDDLPSRCEENGADVLLNLEQLLGQLLMADPQLRRVVDLHVFGGLTFPEIAEQEGMSLRTTQRRWRTARAWLSARLAST